MNTSNSGPSGVQEKVEALETGIMGYCCILELMLLYCSTSLVDGVN
jgi:hypothetical protein